MDNSEVYGTSSIGELIGSMLAAEEIRSISPNDHVPTRNLWGFVRGRLITHKLEACVNDICVPVIENGQNPNGLLYPLHAALCIKHEELRIPYDILVQLIEAFPSALCLKTDLGFTPLHLAVNISDIKLTEFILIQYPNAASLQSTAGLAPLHLAKSAAIARLLLEKYPAGVGIKDQYGNLPLHLAICHITYTPEVVDILLEMGAQCGIDGSNGAGGALTSNILSYYPLKVAIDNVRLDLKRGNSIELEVSWGKLKCCLFSVSKSRSYHSGSLLHICMGSLSDECLLKFAIEQCEGDVYLTDICGRYPLHIAASNPNIPGSIIRFLLKKYPAAASSFDLDSKLPVHYAASSGRKFDDGLKELVSSNSLALTVQGRQSNLFPFMMAAEGETSSIDSIYGLLRAEPNFLLTLIFPPTKRK